MTLENRKIKIVWMFRFKRERGIDMSVIGLWHERVQGVDKGLYRRW